MQSTTTSNKFTLTEHERKLLSEYTSKDCCLEASVNAANADKMIEVVNTVNENCFDNMTKLLRAHLEASNVYGSMMKIFPLYIGTEAPLNVRKELAKHNSPACANTQGVYLDIRILITMLLNAMKGIEEKIKCGDKAERTDVVNRAKSLLSVVQNKLVIVDSVFERELNAQYIDIPKILKKMPADEIVNLINKKILQLESWCNVLIKEAVSIIAHEYNHIMRGHTEIKIPKGETKIESTSRIITAEIEANRGTLVSSGLMSQSIAVNDKNMPVATDKFTFSGIYENVMEHLKKKGEGEGDSGSSDGNGSEKGSGKGNRNSLTSDDIANSQSGSRNDAENIVKSCFKKSDMKKLNLDELIEQVLSDATLRSAIQNALEERDNETDDKTESDEQKLIRSIKEDIEERGDSAIDDIPLRITKLLQEREIEKLLSHLKLQVRGKVAYEKCKTYSRQSKRQSLDGFFKKGVKKQKSVAPKVLVTLDASGSMSCVNVEKAVNVLYAVAKIICGRNFNLTVIPYDNYVFANSLVILKSEKDLKLIAERYRNSLVGGGTNFSNVYQYALKNGYSAVINITDGEDTLFNGYQEAEMRKKVGEEIKKTISKPISWTDLIVQCDSLNYAMKVTRIDDKARLKGILDKFVCKIKDKVESDVKNGFDRKMFNLLDEGMDKKLASIVARS